MFQTSQLFISYKHIQAKTPKQLEREMLKIQVAEKKPIEFTPPTFSNNKWNTWYLYDYSNDVRPQDKIKLNNTGGR